jgi:hypothetical protein
LISADELRAAGALDVPASWRNSLRVERDLFSGLLDDEEDPQRDQTESNPGDEGDDEASGDQRECA